MLQIGILQAKTKNIPSASNAHNIIKNISFTDIILLKITRILNEKQGIWKRASFNLEYDSKLSLCSTTDRIRSVIGCLVNFSKYVEVLDWNSSPAS